MSVLSPFFHLEYPEKTTDLPQSTDQLVNFAIYTLRQKFKSHPVFFSLFLKMKEDELGMRVLRGKTLTNDTDTYFCVMQSIS
jgi:hypothetical protein